MLFEVLVIFSCAVAATATSDRTLAPCRLESVSLLQAILRPESAAVIVDVSRVLHHGMRAGMLPTGQDCHLETTEGIKILLRATFQFGDCLRQLRMRSGTEKYLWHSRRLQLLLWYLLLLVASDLGAAAAITIRAFSLVLKLYPFPPKELLSMFLG